MSAARGSALIVLGALASLLSACAPPARRLPPSSRPVASAPSDAGTEAAAPDDDIPTLDEIAARGPDGAPLMREILRVAHAAAPIEVKTGAADACFRAVVASASPVRAWFEDQTRTPRGEVARGPGPVPPRGPACARKGETLRLVVEPEVPARLVRAVVWQSP